MYEEGANDSTAPLHWTGPIPQPGEWGHLQYICWLEGRNEWGHLPSDYFPAPITGPAVRPWSDNNETDDEEDEDAVYQPIPFVLNHEQGYESVSEGEEDE